MAGHNGHSGEGHPHILPVSFYTKTLFWLMVLLVITIAAAFPSKVTGGLLPDPMPWMATIIALTIAVIKMTIVIMNFMHARFSGKMVWLFAAAGFFWLVIMVIFAFSDYVTRPWEPPHGWPE